MDDMPGAAFTHTVRGFFGEELTIVAYAPVDAEDGGAVEFVIKGEGGETVSAHISSPAERESFAKAWMEACRIAGGEPAGTAGPAGCGQCDDGLVEAKGCNCGSPADEAAGFRHENLCGFEPCPNGCWDKLHPAQPPEVMCATPGYCPNGPRPHAFIPDNETVLPCCPQPWEALDRAAMTGQAEARDHG